MESEEKSFDFELCFRQSYEVYRSNFLVLILTSLVVNVLGIFSFGIFMGPLSAGFLMILLKSMRTHEAPKFDDLFQYFGQFGRLFLLFFIVAICSIIGFAFLIVPGILIVTIWMYAFLFACDKYLLIGDALGESYRLVTKHVLWKHVVLMIVVFTLHVLFGLIPHVVLALTILISPLTYGIIVSAYHQLVDVDQVEYIRSSAN